MTDTVTTASDNKAVVDDVDSNFAPNCGTHFEVFEYISCLLPTICGLVPRM